MSKQPELIAYFEEFITNEPGLDPRSLGVRVLESNHDNRTLGAYGRRDLTLTENIELQKCFKTITIKASAKKPLKVFTMLQRLEGRYK